LLEIVLCVITYRLIHIIPHFQHFTGRIHSKLKRFSDRYNMFYKLLSQIIDNDIFYYEL